MKTERKTLKEQTGLFPISSKTSKRILLALAIIYILFLVFKIYTNEQIQKRVSDVKWQYLSQVIYQTKPERVFFQAPHWNDAIMISIIGKVTDGDLKTIQKITSELKELTGLKITFRYHIGKYNQKEFSKWMNESLPINYYRKGNVKILFQDSSITKNENWITYTFAKYDFHNFENIKRDSNGALNTIYYPDKANLYIKADETSQKQRDNYILKGLANIFLCKQELPLKERTKIISLKASGQEYIYYLNSLYDTFNSSVFNPKSEYCTDLTDVDKFILKTKYSNDPKNLMNKINGYSVSNTFSIIEIVVMFIFILFLYSSGFFHKTFFYAIDNKVTSKWLAFNFKILSLAIFSIALTFISNIISYYTSVFPHSFSHSFLFPLIIILTVFSFITFLIAIPANLIYLNENSWFPKFEQFAKQQIFSFAALSCGFGFSVYLMNFIYPQRKLNLLFAFSVGIIIGIIRFLYNYSSYQRKLALLKKDQELNRLRELKTRAELDALQSKINPHFLYNALNSIAGLAHEDAAKTEHMALSLSKLFRYSINKENDDFATVKYEMDLVSIYLDIEKVRFGEKFQYILNMEKDLENELIPKFILQPLVENAIKHGISKVNADGILKIEISRKEKNLIMKVSDNGPAFPEDLMTGYGLHNIYEKLDILYPGKYEVVIQNGNEKNISVILSN